MKQFLIIFAAVLLAASCQKKESLRERAAELTQYLPSESLQENAAQFLTPHLYAVLDTLYNRLPEHEAMDHEWLHYFVTSSGSALSGVQVTNVEESDDTHAVATLQVRTDPSDETSAFETHQLLMEKVNGQWLLADFDNHLEDCQRHIALNQKEEALRQAIRDYLVREIGNGYNLGEICIPTLIIVAQDENLEETQVDDNPAESQEYTQVWLDTWIDWFNVKGDTLKSVSGGHHSGLMKVEKKDCKPVVTSFEQVSDGSTFLPSAKRIFGDYFEQYQQIYSNDKLRDAARKEQVGEYVRQHQLPVTCYQDYGWPAVSLEK